LLVDFKRYFVSFSSSISVPEQLILKTQAMGKENGGLY
jgi:hypothetical protein